MDILVSASLVSVVIDVLVKVPVVAIHIDFDSWRVGVPFEASANSEEYNA